MQGNLDINQIIKECMLMRRCSQKLLAEKCGITAGGFSYKMQKNAFSVHDLEKIAEVMDCNLEIRFIPR